MTCREGWGRQMHIGGDGAGELTPVDAMPRARTGRARKVRCAGLTSGIQLLTSYGVDVEGLQHVSEGPATSEDRRASWEGMERGRDESGRAPSSHETRAWWDVASVLTPHAQWSGCHPRRGPPWLTYLARMCRTPPLRTTLGR